MSSTLPKPILVSGSNAMSALIGYVPDPTEYNSYINSAYTSFYDSMTDSTRNYFTQLNQTYYQDRQLMAYDDIVNIKATFQLGLDKNTRIVRLSDILSFKTAPEHQHKAILAIPEVADKLFNVSSDDGKDNSWSGYGRKVEWDKDELITTHNVIMSGVGIKSGGDSEFKYSPIVKKYRGSKESGKFRDITYDYTVDEKRAYLHNMNMVTKLKSDNKDIDLTDTEI